MSIESDLLDKHQASMGPPASSAEHRPAGVIKGATLNDFLKFALLGLGSGGAYALLASGAVVIYRGSGVVNFAQGSFALVGAYTYYELHGRTATWVAVAAAVVLAAVFGLATQELIMWRMRASSPLARIVATLAIVVVISQIAVLRFGDTLRFVDGFLPNGSVQVNSAVIIPAGGLWLFGIAAVLTVGLWAFYRYSKFGLATSAVAENQEALACLGRSPRSVARINWTIGAGLAGLAGVLLVPITGLDQAVVALVIIPALSAALVGGFVSFPLTLLGAAVIGILESETTHWITSPPGLNVAVPFAVILFILLVRGKALPLRSFRADRLPSVGSGRISPTWVMVGLVVTVGSLYLFDNTWSQAVTASATAALIGLSLVVVTGYAGQISLAQYAFAGIGGFIASRLTAAAGVPFPWSIVLGVLATVPVGMIFALPAVRARGVNLAVATLGGAVVIESVVLSNTDWTGGVQGTQLPSRVLFGLDVDYIDDPPRYAALCAVVVCLAALVVANVRRGQSGRRLLAVRDNERAAASLGISVVGAKTYAFGIGAGLAALGGGLAAFQFSSVDFTTYAPLTDVNFLMYAVIGGLAYNLGGITAGFLVLGGLVQVIIGYFVDITHTWDLILGILLLIQLTFTPDGIVRHQIDVITKVRRFLPRRRRTGLAPPLATIPSYRTKPKMLELRDVTVRYGGTTALDSVSLTVRPGEVVGLIGPNGAGKTTLIDAATGFVRPAGGRILFDGKPVDGLSVQQRAKLGLIRSWQSLELFEDMNVEENLLTASESRSMSVYLSDLVRPRRRAHTKAGLAAIAQFSLDDSLTRQPTDLPYAVRRLVGIARSVAMAPSVLLLDEPAAGLDDKSTGELVTLIRQLAADWGMGILLVEHDVSMVMRACDTVVAIDFGRHIVTGPPEDVRSDPRVIEAYLGGHDLVEDVGTVRAER
ncbi:ATP-binding cassette domain-containing protein [Amycolatopsis sp. K13G38]|uniref:ATP-binding cassette domain-containing protein n=1 Tax=Amycolatopsis acididurans TaxID=2724524 RepID=A0ABX1JCI4_9PSEU|nr:branched-chain amino acid ABC transporter permease/ATP-binding protein [Amycolatopsis acididurans]NKQ56131.1 ATP-binding cassette domain-containing protein [Amycolatopsis acididurans]